MAPCAHECSLVHWLFGSFCWNSNWGNHKTALFMEIIWSHSSLCNMETTCSWISKAMTAAEDHIFLQYHCFEGGETSPFWALLDHWFDSETARKGCKSKGISKWFVSYFVNKVQIIEANFPSVSNHFSPNLVRENTEGVNGRVHRVMVMKVKRRAVDSGQAWTRLKANCVADKIQVGLNPLLSV